MQRKKEYHKPEIKQWGTVTDLTQSGIIEALFGSSSKGSGSSVSNSATGEGSPVKPSSNSII